MRKSSQTKKQPNSKIYDLAIIGAGINGAAIAREAALKGLSVYLCDQGDIGGETSSYSTKLIHGGLRYLENYDFSLVRKAIIEREHLLNSAPHLVKPIRLVMPYDTSMRPAWLIRIGLFIYDHLAKHSLEKGRTIDLYSHEAGLILANQFTKGFMLSDCQTMDNRLVILNALDAQNLGATIQRDTKCLSAAYQNNLWTLTLKAKKQITVKAKQLVNAGGPWVNEILTGCLHHTPPLATKLVKGSHIVTKKLFDPPADKPFGYMFQNHDGRVLFALPYEKNYTLIGTTEVDFKGDPHDPQISPAEIDYLLTNINHYLLEPISKKDIVWSYSGVRPLYEDMNQNLSKLSRDFQLKLEGTHLLHIYGGKLTTHRELAEEALLALGHLGPSPSHDRPLPGGDFGADSVKTFQAKLCAQYPALKPSIINRWVGHYGKLTEAFISNKPGKHFGDDIYQCEIDYLIQNEWATDYNSLMFKRTKYGFTTSPKTQKAIEKYLSQSKPPKN